MLRRSFQSLKLEYKRKIYTTKCTLLFYEPDRKRGLKTLYDIKENIEESFIKQSMTTFRIIKEEFKKFKQEMKEKLSFAPELFVPSGELDIIFRFNKNPKCLDNWIVNSEKDYNLGSSTGTLQLSANGTGVFSGYLNTTVPKDGTITKAGFVNMTTIPKTKSFFRNDPYNWLSYTHLVFRVRGDGRKYQIILLAKETIDMTFFDMFVYVLHTRGGPYWQYTRIPFSKFVFVSKGYVQDFQNPLLRCTINKIGINIADKITGPFRLEIDYIGVECDDSHTEEHAYELYRIGKSTI